MAKILLIKNDGLGDLVLINSFLNDLSHHIEVVTCSGNQYLAENLDNLAKIHYVSRDSLTFEVKNDEVIPEIKDEDQEIISYLKNTEFDIVICLRRFIRKSSLLLMTFANGAKKYSCWQYPINCFPHEALLCTRHWINLGVNEDTALNEREYYKKILTHIFNQKFSPKNKFSSFPQYEAPSNKKIALIISGSANYLSMDFYKGLIELLIDNDWQIAVFGGTSDIENEYAGKLSELYTEVSVYNGKVSFCDHYQTFKENEVVLGQDTGLTHFAATFHPRVIAICGNESYGRFWNHKPSGNHLLITRRVSCADCLTGCEERPCLHYFNPEDIFRVINDYDSKVAQNQHIELNPDQHYERLSPISYLTEKFSTSKVWSYFNHHSTRIKNTRELFQGLYHVIATPIIFEETDDFYQSEVTRVFGAYFKLSDQGRINKYSYLKNLKPGCCLLSFDKDEYEKAIAMKREGKHKLNIVPVFLMEGCFFSPTAFIDFCEFYETQYSDPSLELTGFLSQKYNDEFICSSPESLEELNGIFNEISSSPIPEKAYTIELKKEKKEFALQKKALEFFLTQQTSYICCCENDQKITLIVGKEETGFQPAAQILAQSENMFRLRTKFRTFPIGSPQLLNQGIENIIGLLGRLRPSRIALYGSGMHTARLLEKTDLSPHQIIAIIDDNPKQKDIKEISVLTPKDFINRNIDIDIIITSSDSYESEMQESLKKLPFNNGAKGYAMYADNLFDL